MRTWKRRVTSLLAGGAMLLCAEPRPALSAESPNPAAPFRLPEGFVMEQVAAPPQIRFPMFGAFDDRGRLYITESGGTDLYEDLLRQKRTCRVSVLEDHDGDGRYEDIHVFAESFVPSMGIAWRDGKLYVADPPDLVTLEDTDNDGRADQRTVILSGFGHTDNGSLHGLIFGPDGWLYMTMGWPDGYSLKGRDGSSVSGKTGALLRCRTNGAEPQALSRGFDQLIELDFLPGGEIIGSQTWYQNPSGGIRDSITHLVPEGIYPQRWQDEEPRVFVTGDTLPAILMLPAVAHSGIALYRGHQFPAEWRGQLFSAQFNTRKVVRHPLPRDGSTFRSESHNFVTTDDPDFRPADVLEDADGSLLILDTGSWYVQHCPTGRMRTTAAPGAIYRVRRVGAKPIEDPRGLKLEWNSATAEELVKRLADPRMAVRERAVETLVKRGGKAVPALSTLAKQPATQEEVLVSAVWVLARIGGEDALSVLRQWLEERSLAMSARADFPSVISATARALALHADKQTAPALEKLLKHPEAAVRLAAAESLAACGRPESASALIAALAGAPDRMLEHVLICALRRQAPASELRAALAHPSPVVQKAALLVLDQPPHRSASPTDVLMRLSSTNEPLRRAAQYCLRSHADWAKHALDFIRKEMHEPQLDPAREAALLDLLRAFQADDALVTTVAQALNESDEAVNPARKVSLLGFIAQNTRAEWPGQWVEAVTRALDHSSAEIRAEAVRAAAASGTNLWDGALWKIARKTNDEPSLRVEALAGLARRQPRLDMDAVTFLAAQLRATNSSLARLRTAEVLAMTEPPTGVLRELIAVAGIEPSISPSLVLTAVKRSGLKPDTSAPLLEYLAASVERGWPVTEAQLDWVLKAAPESARAQATELTRAIREQAAQQQALMRDHEPLLDGGDATRGRTLFFEKAQCFTCHMVGDQGRPVGPDLTKVGAIRTGRDILESVLLPSVTFAQGFDTYAAETKDGESVTGSLVRETPEFVVLRNASGAEVRLRRNEVESMTKSRLSMMPEGLLQALTRAEAADLLAFLQDLK